MQQENTYTFSVSKQLLHKILNVQRVNPQHNTVLYQGKIQFVTDWIGDMFVLERHRQKVKQICVVVIMALWIALYLSYDYQ